MSESMHDFFWRDGYVIARQALPRSDIFKWRESALRHTGNGDLLSDPALRGLLLDPRILALAREILGPNLVYFQDSSVSIGDTHPGFHKDCVDRDDPKAPDWQGRYPIIRIGIYMQDHFELPGGLDLRVGSHEFADCRRGRHVYANTRAGDVVIWSLRTTHSGTGAMLARGNRALDPSNLQTRLLRRWPMGLLKQHPLTRVAAFMTFGAPGAHLQRYLTYLKTREYAIAGWRASVLDAIAISSAAEAGVEVRDMLRSLEEAPSPYVSSKHRPLPY